MIFNHYFLKRKIQENCPAVHRDRRTLFANNLKCRIWFFFQVRIQLSGNTVWLYNRPFWAFLTNFCRNYEWDFFLWFSNTVQTEEMKLILNPLGILMTLEMHHHSSTSYPTFTIKVALLLQSAHLLSKLVQKVVPMTLWFLLEYVPKAKFIVLI